MICASPAIRPPIIPAAQDPALGVAPVQGVHELTGGIGPDVGP